MFINYINPIAFQIGPFQIHWYAIAIVTGIFLAVYLARQEALKIGLTEDDIYDFVIYAVPLSFIGARAYYVIFEWPYYRQHPDQILAIWNGGIAIYGGLIAGAIFLYFFCKKRHISLLKYLDVVAPTVLLAQGIGRWGNFFNHEAFGSVITRTQLEQLGLPAFIIDNMKINELYRQPTFLYESIWDITGVGVMMFYRHLRKEKIYEGEIASLYLIWYAFGRFFIEGMRSDSLYLYGSIRVSQVVSVVLFVAGIILWCWTHFKSKRTYSRI